MFYRHPHPPSTMARVARLAIRVLRWKQKYERDAERGRYHPAAPIPSRWRKKLMHQSFPINGQNVDVLTPPDASGSVLIYLHGGAYIHGIMKEQWNMVGELALRSGATVYVVDYPLPPAGNAPTALDLLTELYQQLCTTEVPGRITLFGDSAGGGLALVFGQHLRSLGLPQPAQYLLIAPWLDLSMTNAELPALEARDPLLSIRGERIAGRAWAGGMDVKDPLVSPIYGRFHDLAPIRIFIGTDDLMEPDTRKLRSMLEAEGVHVDYFEYPRMFHVWTIVTDLPEAKTALGQMAEWLRAARVVPLSH